jgi:hypothetical protein
LTSHSDPEVQRLSDEVEKLGRVITDVVGSEFDSIMSRQIDDQRVAMRWMATCMALNMAMMQLLEESGLIQRAEVGDRVNVIRERLLKHAESLGKDAEVADIFGDAFSEEPTGQ